MERWRTLQDTTEVRVDNSHLYRALEAPTLQHTTEVRVDHSHLYGALEALAHYYYYIVN